MNNQNLKPGDLCLVLPCNDSWQPMKGKTVTLVRISSFCVMISDSCCPHWEIAETPTVALSHNILMKISGGDEVKGEESLKEIVNEYS